MFHQDAKKGLRDFRRPLEGKGFDPANRKTNEASIDLTDDYPSRPSVSPLRPVTTSLLPAAVLACFTILDAIRFG